jgi:polysaccharide biosynthesis protein PslG
MRSRPPADGTTRGLALEALATGLAYAAGLCWASVCLLGSFAPTELSAPYWEGLPGLRSDTCGIAAFFVAGMCFGVGEYLRSRRGERAPSVLGRERWSAGRAGAFALAASKTVAILASGLVVYLSINAVAHPATLGLPATHLASWPTEGTLRVAALLLCACSVAALRYLRPGRTRRRMATISSSATWGTDPGSPLASGMDRGTAPPASQPERASRTAPARANAVTRFWPVITVILGAGALLVTAAVVLSPAPAPRYGIADPYFVGETAGTQASQVDAMKAIGITSLRFDADWDSVQHAGPGAFDWASLDRAVSSARTAGLSVDLTIYGCPPWAASASTRGDPSPTPASPALYARWAAEVAARYAPKGVNTFEIWNEPNNALFWPPRANPSAYTADLVAAYSAIKAVDPSAFVISGGLAPEPTDGKNMSAIDFLKTMYADGAEDSFDALGYHPYSFPALPQTYEPWSAWSQMAQTHPSIRSVMASNGDGGKPIWITEFGAPTGGPRGVGEAAQAAALTQAIADTKATSWIGALYIYTWQDKNTDPGAHQDWFGLLTAGGSRKPAYEEVARSLG